MIINVLIIYSSKSVITTADLNQIDRNQVGTGYMSLLSMHLASTEIISSALIACGGHMSFHYAQIFSIGFTPLALRHAESSKSVFGVSCISPSCSNFIPKCTLVYCRDGKPDPL